MIPVIQLWCNIFIYSVAITSHFSKVMDQRKDENIEWNAEDTSHFRDFKAPMIHWLITVCWQIKLSLRKAASHLTCINLILFD